MITADAAPFLERMLITYARQFPLRKGKLRVIDHLWQKACGHDHRRMALLKCGGFKMPCDLDEMLQRQFYFFGTYFVEEHILTSWANAARKARVVFDVGANAGIYGLTALASEPGAIVHSFEPSPEIARKLRATAALNNIENLIVHEFAVYHSTGRAILQRYRGGDGSNEGMNFVRADNERAGGEVVPTISLDEFCVERNISKIDLLKIDVQGQEHAVLQGAQAMIEGGRVRTIFMELNWLDRPLSTCPAERCVRILARAGYRFSAPEDYGVWRDGGDWLRGLNDVVAYNLNAD